ncbi:hypothetical protein AQUCO_04200030v1 [Aquilegia coerulea]|uniref:Cytochrome P450 n=1 Tax=Aquilegia coerulea TaxID=218851 RepID=A0A2G5CNX5_AQUCA|nr:hypothetical protein AQUCO_04200030v1 [Aquilegia coerulea]
MAFFYFFAVLIVFILILKGFFHRTQNRPPSPFALPILGHLYLLKNPLYKTFTKLSEQYDPILFLRYGFREVLVVSSSSAIEECLTKNDIAFADRPQLIAGQHLGYNYSSLIWAPYGNHLRNLRRIITLEIFSSVRLQLLSVVRKEEIRYLVLQLFGNSDCKTFHKVEFKTMFFEMMLNILMRMIAGKRYYGENVVDLDEAKRFRNIVSESFYLLGTPNFGDFLPFLRRFDVQGLEKRMVKVNKERDIFLQNLLDQGRQATHISSKNDQEKKTMIDVLLSQQKTDPGYYTDEIIKGLIETLLSAGTDTSSSTLEWAMSLLLNHPDILNKAKKEIDMHVGKERLIEESDLPKLGYLNNIINETLRIYPPGPVLYHESSKDCSVGGFHVPSGTIVQMNVCAVHRDPKLWVEPMQFNPDRFEDENEGFKFIPFGSGRRKCPGEGLAIRMVGLALGSLIQCFEWKRVGEEMVDMTEGTGLTLPKANPLVAMCKPNPTLKHLLTRI